MGKSEVDEYLDSGSNEPLTLIRHRGKKSQLELAGENVMRHLMKLATTTDLSYRLMAEKISDTYSLKISTKMIRSFFENNPIAIKTMIDDQKSLSQIRADIYLEYNTVLVNDIKIMDQQIKKLEEDEFIETDKKAKGIADLLDKKGRLLLRHARLSGTLQDKKAGIDKLEVNLYQQINAEKSDVLQRLRKAEFKEKVVDVKVNEDKKRNP